MDAPIQGPVFLIETDRITPNPQQPRRVFDEDGIRDLANSIREFGILQPIVVTKLEKVTETGTEVHYQLIAGERRLMASRMAGLERIPAIVRSVELDKERLELAIVENIQRVDLNPIESARAFSKLQDQFGLTQREIGARLGKSRESVANTMRLLSLPNQVQEAIGRGQVSESQARMLLMVSDMGTQQALFEDILKNNVSVRELKNRIRKTNDDRAVSEAKEALPPPADPELMMMERELEEALGTKVRVERAGGTGKITIAFYSPEELQGIVERLRERHEEIAPEVPPAQPEATI